MLACDCSGRRDLSLNKKTREALFVKREALVDTNRLKKAKGEDVDG
jgi:hypothetical protein